MFNYPFYANPTFYTSGMESGMLGAGAASGASGAAGAGGLLRGMASKFSWSGFLTGAGKTLNVINQAIPIFYQVRPIVKNAKTMFRVLGAVKGLPSKDGPVVQNIENEMQTTLNEAPIYQEVQNRPTTQEEGKPTFFL